MTTTFKQFLIEDDNKTNVFNFQLLKSKIYPRLQKVLDSIEGYNGYIEIEYIDLLQYIKQLIIESNLSNEELLEDIKDKFKRSLKIIYEDSVTTELYNIIEKEIFNKLEKEDLNTFFDNDLTLSSSDEFGNMIYKLYKMDLSNNENIISVDMASIKNWINKVKRGGKTLSAQVHNRIRLKEKLYRKLEKDVEFEEIEF